MRNNIYDFYWCLRTIAVIKTDNYGLTGSLASDRHYIFSLINFGNFCVINTFEEISHQIIA